MTFSRVFVAGAGFMGSGIAYLILEKTDALVFLYDIYAPALEAAKLAIEKIANNSHAKGFIKKDELKNILERIYFTGSEKDAKVCDLVIEAIAEDLQAKQQLFGILDTTCQTNTIFASNTSSLSITTLAASTKRPEKFIGMHFFSPPYMMKLLELIPGLDTSLETKEKISQFGQKLGKVIINSRDMPGFITTRLGLVLINEACFAAMEGLSTPAEIDQGMTLGYNHPMGPLALADFIGLDICLNILQTLYDGFGDPKYRPCPLLKQLVAAGHLGRKAGRGFYKYEKNH